MQHATGQVRQALADMVKGIIQKSPPLTHLDLEKTVFNSQSSQEICSALRTSNTTSLTWISMNSNPEWYDIDEKCCDWALALERQTKLRWLYLHSCNIQESGKNAISAAVAQGCT